MVSWYIGFNAAMTWVMCLLEEWRIQAPIRCTIGWPYGGDGVGHAGQPSNQSKHTSVTLRFYLHPQSTFSIWRVHRPWITPGSLEAVGSGKDQGHGSGEEVSGRVEGPRGGDGA
jgi:hypothetical protein